MKVEKCRQSHLNVTNKNDQLNSVMSETSLTLCCTGQGLVMAEMSHAVISIDLRREMVQMNKPTSPLFQEPPNCSPDRSKSSTDLSRSL